MTLKGHLSFNLSNPKFDVSFVEFDCDTFLPGLGVVWEVPDVEGLGHFGR